MEYTEDKVILKAVDLKKTFGSGDGMSVALGGVSLDIYKGELLIILGSSGSGKSTLLNLIAGIDRPSAGEVYFEGKPLSKMNDSKLTEYRKNSTGFVFQSFNLIQELTAIENIRLITGEGKEKLIKECLDTVGLWEKRDRFPKQLSGGEQQRVSIARALAKNSDLLLCDEPTGALDYVTGRRILVCLEQLCRKNGKTVVIVTHTKEMAAIADRVITMQSGKILSVKENRSPVGAETVEW